MEKHTQVLGAFEPVSLPGLGIFDVVAKIDTGAYSGALHCDIIQEVLEDDKKKLRFILSEDHRPRTTTHYQKTWARSSNGLRARRFLINTEIIIRDKRYPIQIGLSNRSEMKHEMLIGRRFLRENDMLVDVRINQEYDTDGKKV